MNQGKLEVVKQGMARVNADILGISELKWTGKGEFNSDDHSIYYCVRSQTQLSDFTFTFHFYALEKEMATHSSVLAWRIQGMGEPGGLPSMVSHRVTHN